MKINKMDPKHLVLLSIPVLAGCQQAKQVEDKTSEAPNIIMVYLDDLGYGDLSSYGATEISTPNIDAMAEGGIRFTDAHSSSATCTPSRYAMLTGEYPWRYKDAKILPGTAPLLIGIDQETLPKMLKRQGYQTAVIGKWHLGLGAGVVDWNSRISPGPNEVGFDFAHILAATQDRVPTVYIENGSVVGLDPEDPIQIDYNKNFEGEPTALDSPELLTMKWHHGHNNSIVNGIPRIGYMQGGDDARWSDVDMADHFIGLVQEYIRSNKDTTFFLYYALQQPHVPRTPHPRFVGSSGMGPRGDVIVEADWCIGEMYMTLQEEGLLENTLIIFSSDNGPVLNDGYHDDAVEKLGDHQPMGSLRGGKYSLFEAGTRVPFITYWKDRIIPGESDALICQLDIYASLASMLGAETEGIDSQDLWDVMTGQSQEGRSALILEATSRTALRKGDWLMIPPYPGNPVNHHVNIELGNATDYQLYDLADDIGQVKDLAGENPDKLKEMISAFEELRGRGYGNTSELELK